MNKLISTIKIICVKISTINFFELKDYIVANLNKIKGKYICFSNVHTVIMSYDNFEYRRVQNNALMCLPDGGPLSSYGRAHGYPKMERITGPDFMNEILKISNEHNYKHFFYGSTNETLQKLNNSLKIKFNGINIVGMYSPPFRDLNEAEDKTIVEKINQANPDFIWVGLGAPKQEIWMHSHMDKVHGLMVGVGAAFDYFAGNIKRAPKWMQDRNLEWLYRLMQDPIRLLPRYLYTNTKYIYLTKVLKK